MNPIQPTPDQPEQERCPTCESERRAIRFERTLAGTWMKPVLLTSTPSSCADPFHDPPPDPPLHQRIEGLIAELEGEARQERRVGNERGQGAADGVEFAASRLRAVLNVQADGSEG